MASHYSYFFRLIHRNFAETASAVSSPEVKIVILTSLYILIYHTPAMSVTHWQLVILHLHHEKAISKTMQRSSGFRILVKD